MAKGVGYCPFCDTPILVVKRGKVLPRPTGAYRSTKFLMVDGGAMTVPLCVACQSAMADRPRGRFYKQLAEYIDTCCVASWGAEKRAEKKAAIAHRRVEKTLERHGPLTQKDAKNGVRIWDG